MRLKLELELELGLGQPLGQRLKLKGQLLLECTFCTIQKLRRGRRRGLCATRWVRATCYVLRAALVVQLMHILGSFVGLKDAREAQPE